MTKKVSFILPAAYVADAAEGILVGEFNDWNLEEGIHLQKQDDGSMKAELVLTAGKTYQYRYLLNDGRWVNDDSEKNFSDLYGNTVENCIITIPAIIKKEVAKKPKAAAKAKIVVEKDDLTRIEGIGKKIEGLLNNNAIDSYISLSKSTGKKIQAILDEAGSKFSVHNPGTWPKQAKLAAGGKWEALALLQKELKGGK